MIIRSLIVVCFGAVLGAFVSVRMTDVQHVQDLFPHGSVDTMSRLYIRWGLGYRLLEIILCTQFLRCYGCIKMSRCEDTLADHVVVA